MKKRFWLLCLFPILSIAQEQYEGQFAIDLPAGYYSNFRNWKEEGVSGGIEVSYLRNNFVYGGGIFFGFGISTNKNNKDGYIQAQVGKQFAFGLIPRAKLNKTQNIYSASITLQFKL